MDELTLQHDLNEKKLFDEMTELHQAHETLKEETEQLREQISELENTIADKDKEIEQVKLATSKEAKEEAYQARVEA